MKIYLWITIALVSLIAIVYSLIAHITSRNQQLYNQDSAILYKIASQLGYKSDDYLNFERSYAGGIDGNFDVLTLLYVTEIPLDQFITRVDGLGYKQSYKSQFNGGDFIHYDSPTTALLTMRQKESLQESVKFNIFNIHYSLQPHGRAWALTGPGGRTVKIQYIGTNERGDVWAYGDKILLGKKIVQVDFDRK